MLGRFYAAVRKATPQVRVLAERHGGDVSFSFDSNGRSVWVMALFGKGAPAFTLLRRAQDRPFDWAQVRLRSFETVLRAASGQALRASSGRAGEETGLLWMTSKRRRERTKRARTERRVMDWSRHRPCQAVAGWMSMLAQL